MTDRELMQQALDALDSDSPDIQLRAATALRARLAQPEQDKRVWCVCGDQIMPDDDEAMCGTCIAFGRAAPPQREWQGLTDEERTFLAWESNNGPECVAMTEAKLKEKNIG